MERDILIFAAALIAACLGFTAAVCRHALRHGTELELGFKGPSVGLWVRLRPGEPPPDAECEGPASERRDRARRNGSDG